MDTVHPLDKEYRDTTYWVNGPDGWFAIRIGIAKTDSLTLGERYCQNAIVVGELREVAQLGYCHYEPDHKCK